MTSSSDLFDSRYFRLNKRLLSILGLWPYDSRKKIVRVIWPFLLLTLLVPHVTGIIVDISDTDATMPHIVVVGVLGAVLLKQSTLIFADRKMESLFDDIASNWSMITDEDERRILDEYSERGRTFTILYTCGLLLGNTLFVLLPLVPEVLNVISPLPVPRPHVYMMLGEFLVENKGDHFYKIYLWDVAALVCVLVICIGIDSTYTVTVDHASALYAIVTHRLSKLRHQIINETSGVTDASYEWVVHIVKLHQIALRFTNHINDSYSFCFFFLIIMNIATLPITCVVLLVNLNNPLDLCRFSTVFVSLMLHLLVLFWSGQKINDHSDRLVEDAYCNDWYETPAKTKKILRILMLRCSEPSILTAGGLLEMNLEVYRSVVKTAGSYITVLASFR